MNINLDIQNIDEQLPIMSNTSGKSLSQLGVTLISM